MVHRRRLEERLVAILDPHIRRKSPLSARLIVAAFGLLALIGASVQIRAQAPAARVASALPSVAAQTPAAAHTAAATQTLVAAHAPVAAQTPVAAPTPAAAQTPVAAQTPFAASVRFDQASITRNKMVEDARLAIPPNIPTVPGRAQTLRGGVLVGRGMTVKELIRDAYGYRNRAKGDIIGGPEWLDTERYDVMARANGEFPPSTSTGLPPAGETALRALLAERLNLRLRIESQTRPVYELVLLRSDGQFGPNLARSEGGCRPFFQREAVDAGLVIEKPAGGEPEPLGPCPLSIRPGLMAAKNMTMAEWAQLLSLAPQVDKTVIDGTGLTGRFDIELRAPEGQVPPPGGLDLLPAMKPGLENQLGLTLREALAPVEVLVIEYADHPSEN